RRSSDLNRIDLVVVAGHDVGLVAQRFGPGVPVVAVARGAVGGDALAAEAPVDRAVAVHFGVGDRVVAGGAGPEMVRIDVHVAGVVDQRAVEPALSLGGLVAHARAAHGDDVVDRQALARQRVGGADHGRAVGVADHGDARIGALVGLAQAEGEIAQVARAVLRVAGAERVGEDRIGRVIAQPDDGGRLAGTGDRFG